MEYIGRVPAPPLDRFIDDIYCLTGVPRYRRMNVPPMPSAYLFVNLGDPVRLWDSDPSVRRWTWCRWYSGRANATSAASTGSIYWMIPTWSSRVTGCCT
jgi:hypothetical protein